MKKQILSFLTAAAAMFNIAVSPVYAKQTDKQSTPSGISYAGIGTEIDSYVKENDKDLASVEVSVFCGDDTLYSGYYGYADIEKKVKADAETVYDWGSCSKLLVWTSVMQLAEDGKIDLDADIRTYLPNDFFKKLQYPDEKITMQNLMSHNAGWQNNAYESKKFDDTLENNLHTTEPYQAYHVGEHTAYSSWGTALAGYIVEYVSGMNYCDYVYENIFKPLGMNDTVVSLAENQDTNSSSMLKRRENLKTYCIDTVNDLSFGTNISYSQLYPAGSSVGTVSDLCTFAKAFTSKKCPLFKNESTRKQMLSATSYYGNSDTPRNCHGMWTFEYSVQALGHSGSTSGCSSALQFDPISGLGAVVMVNEQGDSTFTTGIPQLIFGSCKDSERLTDTIADTSDISGIYVIEQGCKKGYKNLLDLFQLPMPVLTADDTNNYKIPVVDINLKRIADNHWIITDNNDIPTFLYESTDEDGNTMFEMESSDFVKDNLFIFKIAAIAIFLIITLFSLIMLIIKLISKRSRQNSSLSIALIQISFIVITGIYFVITSFLSPVYQTASICCISIAALALVAAINALILIFKTITHNSNTTVRNITWSLCGIFITAFVAYFQMYNFWNC